MGLYLSGCKALVNQFAFYPDQTDVPPEDGLPRGIEEFYIDTEDHVSVQGLYLPRPGSDKALIYFHGNAGNIYHRIPELQQLREFGLNVLGAGYRGYGRSAGKPSEAGIYLDGDAAFKYATEELGFEPGKVIIFGRSIGTTVAINTAQHKQLAGLVLITPLTSGKAYAKAVGLGFISWLAEDAFDNSAKIRNIQVPLLVIHGTSDRVVPFAMGREIFEHALTDKQFVEIKGAGHNDLQDDYQQEYWLPIADFIQRRLPQSPAPH